MPRASRHSNRTVYLYNKANRRSPIYPLLESIRGAMKTAGFESMRTLTFPQPCYPTGWWSATLARKNGNLDTFRESAATNKGFATEYYNLDMHKASLAQPEFLKRAFSG